MGDALDEYFGMLGDHYDDFVVSYSEMLAEKCGCRKKEFLKKIMRRGEWKTGNNDIVKICNMKTFHIKNTIKWLKNRPDFPYCMSFVNKMRRELNKRGIEDQKVCNITEWPF